MKPLPVPTFQPRMRVLGRDQALAIHHAALDILRTTGVLLEHEESMRLLRDAGATLSSDGRLRLPPHLPEQALRTAPRSFVLHDQAGRPAMPLRHDRFFYGTGSDATFTVDPGTGERRRATLEDVGRFARLVDGLEHLDFVMSMANPEDVPVEDIYVHVFAAMLRHTSKPLVFIADSGRDIARIHEMACCVAGGEEALEQRPFLLNYSEAISPLRFPANVMEKLVFCARKRLPLCLPSGSNAGGGAPVTLAGAMALGIAENLVGLAVHQLARPGAPFLFGPNVSVLDMKSTVVSYGCPEWSLTQAALADMRDHLYGLPVWAYAGATDAKTVDAQAGAEAMFSVATAMLSRANLIHDMGFLEFGTTSSPAMVALVDELVAMARFFARGVPVDEKTLALDVIDRVARGGDGSIFLTEDHTFEHFLEAQFHPALFDRRRFDAWRDDGARDLRAAANARAESILAEHRVEPKPAEILAAVEAVVNRAP